MIRWFKLDKAGNKANAYFMTIHVVIPSSGHGKSQSWERYLNHVYELCNLLQFKHEVNYVSVDIMIIVVLSASNSKTPGDISPAYRNYFIRVGLWLFRIKHNSFTIFTLIPNNSMKESSRVFELLFLACVITVKKRNFQSKKIPFTISHVPAITLFLLVHLEAL